MLRLVQAVDLGAIHDGGEPQWAKVLTGLLLEVDPNFDLTYNAHMPASTESEVTV